MADWDPLDKEIDAIIEDFCTLKDIWIVQKELRQLIFVYFEWKNGKICKKSNVDSLKW